MKLTNRDIKIIQFLEENKGATIQQIQELFFPSYNMAAQRLKILSDNKFIKVNIHPILSKKVYYMQKIPSYHSLIITTFMIKLRDNIKFMEREYKIKNNIVDCIFILKTGQIIILEVDIYNRTNEAKINSIMQILKSQKLQYEFVVIEKMVGRKRVLGLRYGKVEEIDGIIKSLI